MCPEYQFSAIESGGAKDPEQLIELLDEVLDAHCHCQFPESLGRQLTFGGDTRYSNFSDAFPSPPMCLGILDVKELSVDANGTLVALTLRPRNFWRRSDSPRYTLTSVWHEDGWLYYWPEPQMEAIF
jgi:hypothetical protein